MKKQKIKENAIIFPDDDLGKALKYVYENGTSNLKWHIEHNTNPYIEWTIGGITGGSCYGGEANIAVSGEEEPEFDDFDDLLSLLNPDISFLKYKKIKSNLISSKNSGYNDYYGNYTDSTKKQFNIKDVIKYCYDNNLLTVLIPS